GGSRAGEAHELAYRQHGHVTRRAGADPELIVREQHAVDQYALDPVECERRDGAGGEARERDDLAGVCDSSLSGSRRARDLRRIATTVSGQQGEDGPLVAHEDERLDDVGRLAPDRERRVGGRSGLGLELFDARLRTRRAEECRDALDSGGPRLHHATLLLALSVQAVGPVY